jgi:hypothetical protein
MFVSPYFKIKTSIDEINWLVLWVCSSCKLLLANTVHYFVNLFSIIAVPNENSFPVLFSSLVPVLLGWFWFPYNCVQMVKLSLYFWPCLKWMFLALFFTYSTSECFSMWQKRHRYSGVYMYYTLLYHAQTVLQQIILVVLHILHFVEG